MKNKIQHLLISAIQHALADLKWDTYLKEDIILDVPDDKRFGDLSTNLAFRLSKLLKKPPAEISNALVLNLNKYVSSGQLNGYVKEVKVEGAGFINFYLTDKYFYEQLEALVLKGKPYFRLDIGRKQRVLIEFVSANPTGPLSVAHARQAVVGDVFSNLLIFAGFIARREYYLNDEGNQINILGKSVELRMKELEGEKVEFPENYYQGEYIYDIAKEAQSATRCKAQNLADYAATSILEIIKKELDDFGVKFDYWSSQKAMRKQGRIEDGLKLLKKRGVIYEQDGAVWFKSTQFGDDKDRVVIKSDGSYTYLAPDIAYHREKYRRSFSWLINLWGPDHHGYINRLKAAVQALGEDKDSLSIIIVQLASIYREGKVIEMSTRKGQYITLREVLDEVGKDAARFFFLMRKTSSLLDFDLEVAKKQTSENPVYYVQYAHARICSILRNAKGKSSFKDADVSLLKEKEEICLIKKILEFPYTLGVCIKTLDPYLVTVYLQELAEAFHKFYDLHRVLGSDDKLTRSRLLLIEAVRLTIDTGLELLGVSRPTEM